MFCSNCGSELAEGTRFCSNCGTAVAGAGPQAAPPQPVRSASVPDPGDSGIGTPASGDGYLPPHVDAQDLYAGFWRRVVSYLIDFLILLVPLAIVSVVQVAVIDNGTGARAGRDVLLVDLVLLLIVWLYFALFESSRLQATPGKLALGLRVTDAQGGRIGFARATGRFFGKLLSGVILEIGYMMAGWTRHKQGLHDMMAGCLVVRRDGLERLRSGEPWPAGARAAGMPAWAIALVVIAGCFFLIVPILAAISIPAYQNYLVRAQVAEGMSLAGAGEMAIDEYHSEHASYPRSNAEAGLSEPDSITGKYVASVMVGTLRDGTGAIKVDFSNASATVLHGKYVLLLARPQADGSLYWSCSDSTVATKYLPPSCRDSEPR